ncbi:MAG TPA: TraR/DksA C4-type zinc finger protein, partial [Ilumatobacteraceae bacterium]|nr:TraR/DksA C4-type zinc finger protein [Ilumatobacteraceae bacterium]
VSVAAARGTTDRRTTMSAKGSSTSDPRDDSSQDQAARLRELLEQAEVHAAESEAEFQGLLADDDVIQEDRDAAALLLEHARRQLETARSAVAQLEAGTYGRCVKCGNDIGKERLAALVDVTTCVSCAG